MDDRKLLELAAKAAGYHEDQIYPSYDGGLCLYEADEGTEGDGTHWSPLTDDGDALRLAVKLKITPHIDDNLTEAESSLGFSTEPHFNDPYAATRRAIVHAAAAIGQEME